MKVFINKFTGSLTFVEDSRMEEYIEAGHELASESSAEIVKKDVRNKSLKKFKKKGV